MCLISTLIFIFVANYIYHFYEIITKKGYMPTLIISFNHR